MATVTCILVHAVGCLHCPPPNPYCEPLERQHQHPSGQQTQVKVGLQAGPKVGTGKCEQFPIEKHGISLR